MATKAIAKAAASVNICAASESNAKLCVIKPAITSTIKNVVVSAKAIVNFLALPSVTTA